MPSLFAQGWHGPAWAAASVRVLPVLMCMRAANARKFSSPGLEILLFIHERKAK
jgi:hypothetical protein